MDVKDNIRQRRKLKLKEIQEKDAPNPDNAQEYPRERADYHREYPLFLKGRIGPPYFSGDPEEEWKRRRALMWNGYDEFPEDPRYPKIPGTGMWTWKKKWFLSILLFAAALGMFRIDAPWAREGQELVYQGLHSETSFPVVAAWVREYLYNEGTFIPAMRPHSDKNLAEDADSSAVSRFVPPVKGSIVRPFSPSFEGVILSAPLEEDVKALSSGRVVYAGNRPQSGKTIMIQHAGGIVSVYGNLGELFARENDWIEAGEPIAALSGESGETEGVFFFAVKVNDRYVDPAEVVTFD